MVSFSPDSRSQDCSSESLVCFLFHFCNWNRALTIWRLSGSLVFSKLSTFKLCTIMFTMHDWRSFSLKFNYRLFTTTLIAALNLFSVYFVYYLFPSANGKWKSMFQLSDVCHRSRWFWTCHNYCWTGHSIEPIFFYSMIYHKDFPYVLCMLTHKFNQPATSMAI